MCYASSCNKPAEGCYCVLDQRNCWRCTRPWLVLRNNHMVWCRKLWGASGSKHALSAEHNITSPCEPLYNVRKGNINHEIRHQITDDIRHQIIRVYSTVVDLERRFGATCRATECWDFYCWRQVSAPTEQLNEPVLADLFREPHSGHY